METQRGSVNAHSFEPSTRPHGDIPLRLFVVVLLATFLAELFAMIVLHLVPSISPGTAAVIDAALLVVFLFPFFYLFLFLPLVTQMKETWTAQEQTERQMEFTRGLIENAGTPIFVLNRDHRVLYWNRACENLTGISAADVVGSDEHWKAFFPWKRPMLSDLLIDGGQAAADARFPAGGASRTLLGGLRSEGWCERLGWKRYILFEASPVRSAGGAVIAAIETVNDLTERVQTEEAIRAVTEGIGDATGEEFFPRLVTNLARALVVDYAFVGELEPVERKSVHTITVCAHGAVIDNFSYQLHGTPCGEAITSGICYYPEKVAEKFPDDKMLVEMGIESYIGMPLFDSRRVPVGIMVVLKKSALTNTALAGSIMQMFAMRAGAEVERLRTDRLLQDQKALLSSLIERLPAGLIFEDAERRILLANQEVCRMFSLDDYDCGRIVGHAGHETLAPTSNLHADAEGFKEGIENAIDRGEVVTGEALRLADGRVWERDYTPVAEEGGIVGHLWQYRDVTDRVQLEAQLLQAQKMEAIGLLAGGVAHDFNNILTAITGYANLIALKAGQSDTVARYAGHIQSAAEKAAGLTKSLLSFSRKQVFEPRLLDLNQVLRTLVPILQRVIGEDVELNAEIAEDPVTVMADRGQIEQVILNLATNARDAMPHGGIISLTASAIEADAADYIRRGLDQPGRYAEITVSDTGVGMDPDIAKKIFVPFFTTKEVGKGTGLGLAIVHGIVKQHNGVVIVESEPGAGTTFRLMFPAVSAKDDDLASETTQDLEGGNETILVAEDDVAVRRLLKESLEMYGYTVLLAADGRDALDIFSARPGAVDLVITDVIMPRVNGRQLSETIYRMRPEMKILLLSGYTAEVMRERGIPGSDQEMLTKPLVISTLLAKVRSMLTSK